MRAFSRVLCIAFSTLSVLAIGCRQPGLVPAPMYQNQIQTAQQLQARTANQDLINVEANRQLASSRQEFQRLQSQLAQVNQQLQQTQTQLAQAQNDKLAAEQRANQAIAATHSRGGATITANNSLNRVKPQFNIPGVTVSEDTDVVRVQIASTSLFPPNAATLQGAAPATLNQVASELARIYPNQIIGIEGHTDAAPLPAGGPWQSQHHLSTARAMAVYNHLATSGTLRSQQLHVAGHGPNHPRFSNASNSARDVNQRIELVVYPEQAR